MNLKVAEWVLGICCILAAQELTLVFEESAGDTTALRRIGRSLFQTDAGCSAESAANAAQLFRRSTYFSSVSYAIDTAAAQCTLRVRPAYELSSIDIRGESPLFESDILDMLSIYPGMRVSDSLIDGELKTVEKELSRLYGFIDPRVRGRRIYDVSTGELFLRITISHEDEYRLEEIFVRGNRAFSRTRLMIVSGLWRDKGGRFLRQSLKDKIGKIREYYYSKGYYECSLEWDFFFDRDGNRVDLEIDISEGPQYDFNIGRSGPFGWLFLHREFDFSRQGNQNDFSLKRTVFSLKRRLRQMGFEHGAVRVDDSLITRRSKPPLRSIRLYVDTGKVRQKIDTVIFRNTQSVSPQKLREVIALQAADGDIDDDGTGAYSRAKSMESMTRIENYYRTRGYLGVTLQEQVRQSPSDSSIELVYTVNEGVRTVLDSVTLSGEYPPFAEEILADIPRPEYVRIDSVRRVRTLLKDTLIQRGYAYADVGFSLDFTPDSSGASLRFTLTAGPLCRLENIYISGNLHTKEEFIRRTFDIAEGAPFVRDSIYAGIRRVRAITSFSRVSYYIAGYDKEHANPDLFIYVEEEKPYGLKLSTSYDTKDFFSWSVKAENSNFTGMDRQLMLSTSLTARKKGEVNFLIGDPHFLYRDIRATSTFYGLFGLQGSDSNYTEAGNINSISWDISPRLKSVANLSFEARDIANPDSVRNALEVSGGLILDTRNSFIRPRKGVFAQGSGNLSYGFSFREDNYVKASGEVRTYLTPIKKLTLAARLGGAAVNNYSSVDTLKEDQLLTLGGQESVRAFDEGNLYFDVDTSESSTVYRQKGGYATLYGSAELRIPLFFSLETALFYDIGTMAPVPDFSVVEYPRAGYGTGLRYLTPIGAVGVLYCRKSGMGFSAQEQDYLRNNRGLWLFSINYTF
ncbi:MAG: BamA/OMP85 family outer membrane protein [Fibrobacterota bacterium]